MRLSTTTPMSLWATALSDGGSRMVCSLAGTLGLRAMIGFYDRGVVDGETEGAGLPTIPPNV